MPVLLVLNDSLFACMDNKVVIQSALHDWFKFQLVQRGWNDYIVTGQYHLQGKTRVRTNIGNPPFGILVQENPGGRVEVLPDAG